MKLLDVLALGASATSAITGGSLFAFSTLVMPALDRLPAARAVAAMQQINEIAPRGAFVVPLMASALGCLVVGVLALVRRSDPGFVWLLAGAACGVLSFLVTAGFHVPRNDKLALVDAEGAAAASAWADYSGPWTAMNSVRAALALAAAAALIVGVWQRHAAE